MIEDLREGWDGVRAHRARSFLSALGILFGVAALVAIWAIGEGARREQERLIGQLGILNFLVEDRDFGDDEEQQQEARKVSEGLSERDVSALRAVLPRARHVGAMRSVNATDILPRLPEGESVEIVGADPEYLRAWKLLVTEGRALGPLDERGAASVCVLGATARDKLYGGQPAVGRGLWADGVLLTVVGVFRDPTAGSAAIEGVEREDRNGQVLAPLRTVTRRFPRPPGEPELSGILVSLAAMDDVPGHVDLTRRLLTRMHAGADDFELVVPLRLLEQSRAQQQVFNLVMGLIAGISLLVGGIGVMNIMLASVLERTREIGIRLAVGASPADIQRLFLAEAALISAIGGAGGILGGVGLSWGVGVATGWTTAISAPALVGAALISVAEGLLFGWLPARQAAQLSPATAMRQAG